MYAIFSRIDNFSPKYSNFLSGQFFICIFQNSGIPWVYTGRNLYFLSPWLHISTRAFSMDEALGYLRQVSLLVGCHGLMLLFSQNLYVENLIPKVTILDGGTI